MGLIVSSGPKASSPFGELPPLDCDEELRVYWHKAQVACLKLKDRKLTVDCDANEAASVEEFIEKGIVHPRWDERTGAPQYRLTFCDDGFLAAVACAFSAMGYEYVHRFAAKGEVPKQDPIDLTGM